MLFGFNSLYFRLNFAAVAVLLVFLSATGKVLDNAFAASVRQALHERMIDEIYHLLSVAEIDNRGNLSMPLPLHLPDPHLALPNSGIYAFISSGNQLIWRSPSWQSPNNPDLFAVKVGEKSWRTIILAPGKPFDLLGFGFQRSVKSGVYSYNFYLMHDLVDVNHRISQYRQHLWAGLAIAAVILLAAQMLLLDWGLKPIRKVNFEINAIENGEQNRLTGQYPPEIKQLTDNINHLLAQERGLQTRYRNALADLAHSLKTPLAVLTNAEDLPEFVKEQSARMLRIVERQLQRAGTASCATVLKPINIFQVTGRIIASLNKVYGRKNVIVDNRISADLCLRCNEADLIEVFGNLIDNAFKWCHRRIELRGYSAEQTITIWIDDDGPGVSPDHVGLILQRGGRADELTPGHGIGLSLAADIVEAYDGQLRIESSEMDGTSIVLAFKG